MQRRGWFDLIHRCANAAAPTSTPFGRAAATSPPQRQAAPPSMQCNCSDPWSVGRECRGGGAWMDGDLKVGEREGWREGGWHQLRCHVHVHRTLSPPPTTATALLSSSTQRGARPAGPVGSPAGRLAGTPIPSPQPTSCVVRLPALQRILILDER